MGRSAGKSAGKWIKTVLFGKKSSKSSFSKKAATEKEAFKEFSGDLVVSAPVISYQAHYISDTSGEHSEIEKGVSSNLPHDAAVSLPGTESAERETTLELDSPDDAEITRLEQAATEVQAAFRGYQARRAFCSLKGIIRLQALIRGHLVRRQATATLHCMHGIVKLQAVVRGQRVRLSDTGLEVHRKCSLGVYQDMKQVEPFGLNKSTKLEELFANGFIRKLLVSSPTAMPLNLHYDPLEPNSSWNWLERWSTSNFWKPLPQSKKVPDLKSWRQKGNIQTRESEPGRPKRGVWKIPTVNAENNLFHPTSEFEKPKRNLRKALSHQAELVPEHPQNELEKVKRSLRKVSATSVEKVVTEKQKPSPRKVTSSPSPDVPQNVVDNSSEKTSDPTVIVSEDSKQPELETPPKPLAVEETFDLLNDECPVVEQQPLENGNKVVNVPVADEEIDSKEDQTNEENQKTRRRRSFPAKQEYQENVSQNTPTLPSYMAATESAKAKLRAQGSPRFDGVENGFIRRHSLPSSTNSKQNSMSPRMQRPVQANGKGGSKSDRSLLSSRDGHEKLAQPGWRR